MSEPLPRHWFWHPIVRRLAWPVLARLGFVWFLSVEGDFYLFRYRTHVYSATLYFGTDGRMYVKFPDGRSHPL